MLGLLAIIYLLCDLFYSSDRPLASVSHVLGSIPRGVDTEEQKLISLSCSHLQPYQEDVSINQLIWVQGNKCHDTARAWIFHFLTSRETDTGSQ